MLILSQYSCQFGLFSPTLLLGQPHIHTEACSTSKPILHRNVSPYGNRSFQYPRKNSREGQFLLQLQSTPLNNQLCDQLKVFPQGQSSTSIFLPILGTKKVPIYTKPEMKSLDGKTHAVLQITFLHLRLMAWSKFTSPNPGKQTAFNCFYHVTNINKEA